MIELCAPAAITAVFRKAKNLNKLRVFCVDHPGRSLEVRIKQWQLEDEMKDDDREGLSRQVVADPVQKGHRNRPSLQVIA